MLTSAQESFAHRIRHQANVEVADVLEALDASGASLIEGGYCDPQVQGMCPLEAVARHLGYYAYHEMEADEHAPLDASYCTGYIREYDAPGNHLADGHHIADRDGLDTDAYESGVRDGRRMREYRNSHFRMISSDDDTEIAWLRR